MSETKRRRKPVVCYWWSDRLYTMFTCGAMDTSGRHTGWNFCPTCGGRLKEAR